MTYKHEWTLHDPRGRAVGGRMFMTDCRDRFDAVETVQSISIEFEKHYGRSST